MGKEYEVQSTNESSHPTFQALIVSSIDVLLARLLKRVHPLHRFPTRRKEGVFLAAADNARKIMKGDQCLISPRIATREIWLCTRIVHQVSAVPANPASLSRTGLTTQLIRFSNTLRIKHR